MPVSCCTFGCSSRKKKRRLFKFLPDSIWNHNREGKRRRNLWIRALKRVKWTETQIDNARICSPHFISGIILYTIALKDYSIMRLLINIL